MAYHSGYTKATREIAWSYCFLCHIGIGIEATGAKQAMGFLFTIIHR